MRKSEIRIIPKLCPPLRVKVGVMSPPGPMVAPPMKKRGVKKDGMEGNERAKREIVPAYTDFYESAPVP